MQQTRSTLFNLRGAAWRIPAAVILGASAALFVNGYWLIDLIPPGSRQLLPLSLLVALIAAAAYYPLLGWLRSEFIELGVLRGTGVALLGMPLAAFLFFGGTSQWQAPSRYITLLLPSHHLSIAAVPASGDAATALAWFNTSLGDVSYAALDARGWKRQGDELVLQSPTDNELTWMGQTGEKVQFVFHGTRSSGKILVTWDGVVETLAFSETRITYAHTFPIPFYASGAFVILLGLFGFFVLSLTILLIAGRNSQVWMRSIEESVQRSKIRFDRRDAIMLAATMFIALLLRAWHLDNVFPAVDEYYHLIAAQQILGGAALDSVYPRGLWIVTLPVSAALGIFGHQLWAARLAGVLFNVAAIVPLYLLTRKINRPVAVLTCLLYASSPWIITFARVAREYAYYPFYFYWIIYGMVRFVEGIPPSSVLIRDWRTVLRPGMLLLGAGLALPPVFALSIDWLSTFRTILIAYLVFGLFILARFRWTESRNWPILLLVGLGLIASGRAWFQEQSGKLLQVPRLNSLPLEYFLPNPQQQWYFNRVVVVFALALVGALVIGLALRRITPVPLFMLGLFGSYLAVFSLISKIFFHTRHLLTTELWYVVVSALGLYGLWLALQSFMPGKGKIGAVLLPVILGFSAVNVPQIVLPSLSSNPNMPISEDYMHDMSQVQTFMLGHVEQGDVLISTVYGLYATWEAAPTFDAQYRISSQTPKAHILEIVHQHPSGWIVVDRIRLELSSFSARDFAGNGQIEYIGLFGDEYVWHWHSSAAGLGMPAPLSYQP